jgi:hypothetical protein
VDQPEEKKSAPRYLVAYCSIMTLLLAFFIILQAFAPTQDTGLFYTGQGSFIRALETFGLGGVLDGGAQWLIGDQAAARYLAAEGQADPSDQRRIDPEVEDAQRALALLEDKFDVRKPDSLTGWRATLPTPFAHDFGEEGLEADEKEFCKELAWRLAPLVFARGFVIRVGTEVVCSDAEEFAHTRRALAAAGRLRAQIVGSMAPAAQPAAARRLYCFCRRVEGDADTGPTAAGRLRVDILLTKPHASRPQQEGLREGGNQATQ